MFENNSIFNSNSLSRIKNLSSEIINLKEDFKQASTTLNSNIINGKNNTFSNNNVFKTLNSLSKTTNQIKEKIFFNFNIYNKKERDNKQDKNIKIKKAIKNKIIANNINKNLLESLNKSKTQINFFKSNDFLI